MRRWNNEGVEEERKRMIVFADQIRIENLTEHRYTPLEKKRWRGRGRAKEWVMWRSSRKRGRGSTVDERDERREEWRPDDERECERKA